MNLHINDRSREREQRFSDLEVARVEAVWGMRRRSVREHTHYFINDDGDPTGETFLSVAENQSAVGSERSDFSTPYIGANPEDVLALLQNGELLDELFQLANLSDREIRIIKMRFGLVQDGKLYDHDLTLQAIADETDSTSSIQRGDVPARSSATVTRERVRQIVKEAMNKIRAIRAWAESSRPYERPSDSDLRRVVDILEQLEVGRIEADNEFVVSRDRFRF